MLPKANRLYLDKDIQSILKSRNRFYVQDLQITLAKNTENKFRLLVVVPKKLFKHAVHRNSVRRRICAIFEKAKSQNKLSDGWDCMILIKNKEIFGVEIWSDYASLDMFINAKINFLERKQDLIKHNQPQRTNHRHSR